ncbi:hypothetical protein [Natrinema sp. 1APR25-10V2]|uniref:DUF7282 domain-containing protein n=1 Tax=Natrinema sp. 1APR25-10V2 TaxID=2951081 RepID=UPI002874B38F|nr:hypothetical protein [Natrinema sp. 1APR25-10V2]MDS0475085.1 hypothetical protein [Natrinema sp. 1APR25-10V2]
MNARKQVLVLITALMLVCSSGAMVTAASGSGAVDESAQVSEDEYEPTNETVEENATDNETVTDDETALGNETTENVTQAAYVTFDDQTTEGETVVVANATLASGGFVTIHDSSLLVGNVIGSVIGTSEYLEAGTHEDIEITLDEPLEEDETLIAMPHRDTNQNETYDFVETEGQADGPYLTSDGEPVTDQAVVTVEDAAAEEPVDNVTEEEPVDNVTEEEPVDNVTEEAPTDNVTEEEPAEATVTFDNQTTEGETVVVAETTLPNPGFVTIHDSSLLEGDAIGSVIGVSDSLEAGTHEDITVTLDEPLEEDETLIAMPHQDTNDNQQYDFVETEGEEDGPFLTAEGEPVTDDALVTVEDAAVDEEPVDNVTEEEPVDNVTEEEPFEEEPGDNVTIDEPMDELPVDAGDRPIFVTIENTTIENLNVENASIYVLVVSPDISADELPDEMENITDEMPAEDNVTEDNVTDEEPFEENVTEEPPSMEENITEENLTEDNVTEDNVTEEEPVDNVTEDNVTEDNVTEEEPAEATVTFDNQTTDGETVVVAETTLPNPGFVTIHDSGLLEGDAIGSVIGTSEYLEAGTEENITVTLDEPLEEDETLIAMPHEDTNDNQTYDFVETEGEEDGPFLTAEGEPVTDEAFVTVEEPEDDVTEDNVTEDNVTEDNLTEDNVTEDNVTEEPPAIEENVTEDNVTEDNVTEEEPVEAESFNVTNLEAPDSAEIGENITVMATVENPTDEERTEAVQFRLEGDLIAAQNVTLEAGASEDVEFEVDTTGLQPGEYVHMVLTDESGEVAMIELTESTDTGIDTDETNETETGLNETDGEAANETQPALGSLA